MELPVVDVNLDTVGASWRRLLQAIQEADFIAVDLELSGLGTGKTRGVQSLEEKYKILCDVVASHAVLSVGVACFRWEGRQCSTQVFNVWLSCQSDYTLNPQSARFLLDHGFDFNKQLSRGLAYSPTQSQSLQADAPSPRSLLAQVLLRGCPLAVHNGWIDLLFLYNSFYSPLPPSLPTFMADLSEMLAGGVFDTKAIADYLVSWEASYLEYVFRKNQRHNTRSAAEGKPHVVLSFPVHPSPCQVDMAPLHPPPSPLSQEELLALPLCDSFSSHGFCRKDGCTASHDVCVVLEQEEQWLEAKRAKRRRRAKYKQGTSDGGRECKSGDITAAKMKFQAPPTDHTPQHKPSFGHRAGFDAFMTGYSLAVFATQLSPQHCGTDDWLSGLEKMRNCLANQRSPVPNQIAKSHFAATSEGHRRMWAKIRELPPLSDTPPITSCAISMTSS